MEAVQSSLEKPIFTADFKAQHTASLTFGFINDTLYTDKMVTIPINNQSSFWSVDGVTFSSNGKSIGSEAGINVLMGTSSLVLFFLQQPAHLLLDTGGVGTTTDPSAASDYWSQVKNVQITTDNTGLATYFFPCDTQSLPDLTLNFGTAGSATISGVDLNMTATDAGQGCKREFSFFALESN